MDPRESHPNTPSPPPRPPATIPPPLPARNKSSLPNLMDTPPPPPPRPSPNVAPSPPPKNHLNKRSPKRSNTTGSSQVGMLKMDIEYVCVLSCQIRFAHMPPTLKGCWGNDRSSSHDGFLKGFLLLPSAPHYFCYQAIIPQSGSLAIHNETFKAVWLLPHSLTLISPNLSRNFVSFSLRPLLQYWAPTFMTSQWSPYGPDFLVVLSTVGAMMVCFKLAPGTSWSLNCWHVNFYELKCEAAPIPVRRSRHSRQFYVLYHVVTPNNHGDTSTKVPTSLCKMLWMSGETGNLITHHFFIELLETELLSNGTWQEILAFPPLLDSQVEGHLKTNMYHGTL